MKKIDVLLCNPPYNDSQQKPIYQKFVELFEKRVDSSVWITPSSWVGEPNWFVSKIMREGFLNMGVQKIIKDKDELFVNARVSTTSVVCEKNKPEKQKIPFIDGNTEQTIFLSKKKMTQEKILFCFDEKELRFLERIRDQFGGTPIPMFDAKPGTWKIGTYNINRHKEVDAIGEIRLMSPHEFDPVNSVKYVRYWETNDEEEAFEILPKVVSFWQSKLIQYILHRVHHTYTATPKTFVWIPSPDYSKVWTDEELFRKYGLNDEEKRFVEKHCGDDRRARIHVGSRSRGEDQIDGGSLHTNGSCDSPLEIFGH